MTEATVAADPRFEKLANLLKTGQETFDRANVKFQERMAKNPAYAFEWAGEVIAASAKARVYGGYLDDLVGNQEAESPISYEDVFEFIKASLTNRVISGAKSPKCSSSAMANLVAQEELSACAGLLNTLTARWF